MVILIIVFRIGTIIKYNTDSVFYCFLAHQTNYLVKMGKRTSDRLSTKGCVKVVPTATGPIPPPAVTVTGAVLAIVKEVLEEYALPEGGPIKVCLINLLGLMI